ncbi:hypothetical protein AtNW77_Chr3g0190461 [Arabidopsis thaliana]
MVREQPNRFSSNPTSSACYNCDLAIQSSSRHCFVVFPLLKRPPKIECILLEGLQRIYNVKYNQEFWHLPFKYNSTFLTLLIIKLHILVQQTLYIVVTCQHL